MAATPPSWSPPDLSGLVLWSEAREEAYADGDPAGTITGLGGMPSFTQATAAAKPTYRVTGGKPEYDFDGIDDKVICASSVAFKHLFVAVKADEASFGTWRGLVTGPAGVGADIALLAESGSTRFFNEGTLTTTYHMDGTSYTEANMQAPMAAYGVVCVVSGALEASLFKRRGRFANQVTGRAVAPVGVPPGPVPRRGVDCSSSQVSPARDAVAAQGAHRPARLRTDG